MAGTKRDPAFLLYCTTWLQSPDVNSLSLEQQGAYVRLLCFAWLHGSIPEDHEELRHLLGLGDDVAHFDRIWSRLGRRWSKKPGTPGQLINTRQEEERAERRQKAEEMRARGQAGGNQSAKQRASGSRAGPQADGQAGPQADGQAGSKPSTSTSTSTSRMDGGMDGGGTPYQVQNGGTVQSPVPGRLAGSAPVAAGDVAKRIVARHANGNGPTLRDRRPPDPTEPGTPIVAAAASGRALA